MEEYLKGHAIAHPTEVFDPDAIRVLTTAFEHAWQKLENSAFVLIRTGSPKRATYWQNISSSRPGRASVTIDGYAMVPSCNTLGQILEAHRASDPMDGRRAPCPGCAGAVHVGAIGNVRRRK